MSFLSRPYSDLTQAETLTKLPVANDSGGKKPVHWSDDEGVLQASNEALERLNNRFFDVAFTGAPAQCDVRACIQPYEAGSC